MTQKRSAVEQRREQITAQVDRLRRQLASKTRKDYSSDFHYQRWLRKSRELIDELLEELSALNEPGEYDELPVAVVADELGFRLEQVKRMIKLGDIEVTGRRSHERVSRRELERLSVLGTDKILRRSAQSAEAVFKEAVSQLKLGDVESAERSYRQLKARQSCVGNYALATEVALKLTKGMYDEAQGVIKFIVTEKSYEIVIVSQLLAEFIQGVCFRDEEARVIISDLLKPLLNVPYEVPRTSRTAAELQVTALYITTVTIGGLEELIAQSLLTNQRNEFYRLMRDGIFSALYAEANSDVSMNSKVFIDSMTQRRPQYWEPARLLDDLEEN